MMLLLVRRYDADSGGTAAVTVRSDGSASLLWPDGSMAATLDAETGFDGAYRLLAMYRSIVGVAASFDSNGGFVQYPAGGLMLVWNKKDGIGTAYAPDGAVTHSFNSRRYVWVCLRCQSGLQPSKFGLSCLD